MPPTLKSSRRDTAELGKAVDRGEDEEVALPRPALRVVEDGLMIRMVLLVVLLVLVMDRRETVELEVVAVEESDTEDSAAIENSGLVPITWPVFPMSRAKRV